jgi:hypothetical protein
MSWFGRLSSSRETEGEQAERDIDVARLDYWMTVQGHECAVILTRLDLSIAPMPGEGPL